MKRKGLCKLFPFEERKNLYGWKGGIKIVNLIKFCHLTDRLYEKLIKPCAIAECKMVRKKSKSIKEKNNLLNTAYQHRRNVLNIVQ
jgi:hypothetical protein